jgi:DedD protein
LEQRVKERLTGASILVVVVVLLVPELFRGDRQASTAAPAAQPAGPPLQSYTIELGTAPAAAPALATAPPQLPPTNAVSPAPAAAAGNRAAVPATAAAPVPAAASPPPAAHATPEPEAAAPPATTKLAGSGWAVQVGSFSRRDNAARMVQQAAKQGLRLSIAGPDDRGLFRVRSSVHADRARVVELQQLLAAKGFKGVIAKVP